MEFTCDGNPEDCYVDSTEQVVHSNTTGWFRCTEMRKFNRGPHWLVLTCVLSFFFLCTCVCLWTCVVANCGIVNTPKDEDEKRKKPKCFGIQCAP